MKRTCLITLLTCLLAVTSVKGQCLSESGRSKLIPFGIHLIGIQKKQDSLQLAILSTKYICVAKGDISNIEFEDGTFIYVSNLLDLNCDGKAYFNLSNSDIESLNSKKVSKIVLGSKFEEQTTSAFPETGQSMELLKLINCVVREESSIRLAKTDTLIDTTHQAMEQVKLKSSSLPSSIDSNIQHAPHTSSESPVDIDNLQPTEAIPQLRTVQFIATSGGKSFSELAYLGTIISEKVANKNLYRYKVQGHFSDVDIQRVIDSLAKHGYQGAFENKK